MQNFLEAHHAQTDLLQKYASGTEVKNRDYYGSRTRSFDDYNDFERSCHRNDAHVQNQRLNKHHL